jgi:hypothetical protein
MPNQPIWHAWMMHLMERAALFTRDDCFNKSFGFTNLLDAAWLAWHVKFYLIIDSLGK